MIKDPFDRTPTFLEQATLALMPLMIAFAVMFWRSEYDTVSVTLALALGSIVSLIIATERNRQACKLRKWLVLIEQSKHPPKGPKLMWDPLVEPLIRPVHRLSQRLERMTNHVADLESAIDSLIAVIPDPVLVIDEQENIDRLNKSARDALGSERTNLPLVAISRDPALIAAIRDAIGSRESSLLTVQIGIDPVHEFDARIEPVTLKPGTSAALVALRERTEQLMIERMRSDFIADASHEMRTPMTTIAGAIETLRGPAKDDPDAWALFLEDMDQASIRMIRLLDDLLSLSKIELDAARAPSGEASIADIARSVAHDLETRAQAREIVVDVKGQSASGALTVPGDAGLLRQVLVNLVENSIKYSHAGSLVTIELSALERGPNHAGPLTGRPCVRFAILDQSDGIEPEHIPRLTERFYRVDKARSRDLGGTGLGLAIVKHVVRRHHGHLYIESVLGAGSTFACYLPVVAGGEHQASHVS